LIDSKERDFVLLGLARAEMAAWKNKKREQAPALHMQLSTKPTILQIKGKSNEAKQGS
jgi:hypothetical protein